MRYNKFDFSGVNYNAMFDAMRPDSARDQRVCDLMARIITEFILPRYTCDKYEYQGIIDGEAHFMNLATGELRDWSDIWNECRMTEEERVEDFDLGAYLSFNAEDEDIII